MAFLIGAHVSIAGSIALAPEREAFVGGNCGQIFTHSPRQWDSPKFTDEDAKEFRAHVNDLLKAPMISHATYLVNLGSSNPKLHHGSIDMMKKELLAAEKLGLPWVCVHPGGDPNQEKAIESIIKALDSLKAVSKSSGVLLENTAGAGSGVATNFDNIKRIIEDTKLKRVGVLLDTCHLYANGYNIADKNALEATVKEFDEKIGLDRLHAVHLNDSKGKLGGHLDRHEHIGLGSIGDDAMRRIVTHPKLRKLPFVLETPIDEKRDHAANIAHVKKLVGE